MTQPEYKRLKTRLTRCENAFSKPLDGSKEKKKTAQALVAEVKYAQAIFEAQGYPDAHHRWERLKEDAEFYLLRNPDRERGVY